MRGYDEIAEWYDALVETGALYQEVILPMLMLLTGDVRQQRVLDLACGQGMVSRALARRGARVIGIDISPRMLGLARRYEANEPLGIEYRDGDAQSLTALPNAAVDGATCCMALMNIDDLPACAAALGRVLCDGGWFIAVITHPCFQSPGARWIEHGDGNVVREVSGYFDERFWQSDDPNGVRGKVGEHHRTMSTYVNTFNAAGFVLARLSEPIASGRRAHEAPGNLEVPSVLGMRFVMRQHAQ